MPSQELQRDLAEELEVPANAALELMLEGDAALKARIRAQLHWTKSV